MKKNKKALIAPVFVIVFGICWLLAANTSITLAPLIWTLGLLLGGVSVFVSGGFSKSTFVLGSTLITCSVMSILRRAKWLDFATEELPLLVIIIGVFMVVNTTRLIPEAWSYEEEDEDSNPLDD